jgi:hypothetical protein
MKNSFLSATLVVAAYFALQSCAQAVTYLGEGAPTPEQKQMIMEVFDCMPRDLDESSLFTLVERDGGQFLSCKRFKTIVQPVTPQSPKTKSNRIVVGMGDK